jgi:FAD/FMN-containing dehydrogenase/Fe-S oxidoreductase
MDADNQRIEEDLRGVLRGEVRCDDLYTQLYSTDASVYELRPLGVVRPRSLRDVVATAQYATENNIPIFARGAGTGLAGESLGRGIVVDFSRYFRRILKVDDQRTRVQAGVVLATLNRFLATKGLMFGPDPAMSHVTTMGSVVAIDAAGSHWRKYGSARRHVEALKIVLADGDVLKVGRHPIPTTDENAGESCPVTRLDYLVQSVAALVRRHAKLIADYRPKSLVNRSGYGLDAVLDGVLNAGELDLAKLLVGSEGTLAMILDATVTVDPLPVHRGCALLIFDSLDKAANAVLELLPLEPAACDLMDRRHLNLARESDVRYELLVPGEAEAVLLIEQQGDSAEEVRARLDEAVELIQFKTSLAAAAHIADDEGDFQLYWGLARRFVPTLYRLQGTTRPVPCIEDMAVPPAALPVFLKHVQDTFKRLQVTASLFGHAGHGQLHIRPFLDLASSDDMATLETVAAELYEKVWLLGGTVSGEHGDGMSRTPFLGAQFGPLVNVFRELKQIFDPQGLLNPGKIVPVAPTQMTQNLRPMTIHQSQQAATDAAVETNGRTVGPFALQLRWQPEELMDAARLCNGCGACRSQTPEVRMCPIFRLSPREEASPRAKANLVRGILSGRLPPDEMLNDACKEVADLCVHCHMCRLECPANVDIPKLMVEAKATYVRTNGLPFHDRLLTRIDSLAALAGRLPGVANWALASPQARWLLEKFLGVAQGRKLPRLARRSFLKNASMRRLSQPVRKPVEKVVYFVDTYANHFDTQLADALVAVLRHNRVSVFVPTDQQEAGMPMISQGVLEPARVIAQRNVALLAEAVRQGYKVISTEPSAVLALTREYPMILDDDEDAVTVAQNSFDACHYLWQLHQCGKLKLGFQPQRISVGYHVPCHLRALGVGAPAENLLRLVPGIRVNRVERGCSGIAGLYGIKRENYRASLRAGFALIDAVRTGSFQIGTTECSACKIQMEQGTTKPTIHPVKLLALAYGLMPELAPLVRSQGKRLVVT